MQKRLNGSKTILMQKPINPESELLYTMLIDPWRREVTVLRIAKDLHAWHKALQCDCLDVGRFFSLLPNGNAIDVWVDDLGQLREPALPTFMLGGRKFFGYGLLTEGADPDTVSVSFDLEFVNRTLGLAMEEWEKRLNPADYLEQMTRVVEWEDWFHAA